MSFFFEQDPLEKFQKQIKIFFEERKQTPTQRFFGNFKNLLQKIWHENEIQTKWSDVYQPRRNFLVYEMDYKQSYRKNWLNILRINIYSFGTF